MWHIVPLDLLHLFSHAMLLLFCAAYRVMAISTRGSWFIPVQYADMS